MAFLSFVDYVHWFGVVVGARDVAVADALVRMLAFALHKRGKKAAAAPPTDATAPPTDATAAAA